MLSMTAVRMAQDPTEVSDLMERFEGLWRVYQLQTVGPFSHASLEPYLPETVCLWRNGSLGLFPCDSCGWWEMSNNENTLTISYNYMDRDTTITYYKIRDSDSWVVAPDHMQAYGRPKDLTVLVPAQRVRKIPGMTDKPNRDCSESNKRRRTDL